MTEPNLIDASQAPTGNAQAPTPINAPRPNHSTGPNVGSSSSTKTPEGKRACALNAYRHGLTGRLNILTPEEQQAYDLHSEINLESMAPANRYERSLAQSIADDRWRLIRARTIEDGIFALGKQDHGGDNTGAPQVDDAFAQARTWLQDSRNLQLLTLYEQRIQRAVDKNLAHLEAVQAKRQAVATEDMRQAKLIYQLSLAEGKPYQPEAYFTAAPPPRESVFSTPEVARALGREILLSDATRNWVCTPELTRGQVAKAIAGELAKASASTSDKKPQPQPPTQTSAT